MPVTTSQGNNHPCIQVWIGDPPDVDHPKNRRIQLRDIKGRPLLIPLYEARLRLHRCEAVKLNHRAIKVVPRSKDDHTLQSQLQNWAEDRQLDNPDLWAQTGLATLDQVDGLPVVGDPIKLFWGPDARPAAAPVRTMPTPISSSKPEKVDPDLKKAA